MLKRKLSIFIQNESGFDRLELILLTLFLLALPSFEAPKNIFLWTYLTLAVGRRLINHKQVKNWGLWDVAFLLLILSALLAGLGAPLKFAHGFSGIGDPIGAVLLGWTIAHSNYKPPSAKYLLFLAVISVLAALCYSFWQLNITNEITTLELKSVGHVNHSAIYLSIVFGISSSFFLAFKFQNKWWWILINFILFIAIVISNSRAAVGIIFIILIFLLFLILEKKYAARGLIILSLTLIGMISLNTSVVKKQIYNQKNDIVLAARDHIWTLSIANLKINPIFGIGLNNWGKVSKDDINDFLISNNINTKKTDLLNVGHGHSIYFNTLSERGILGIFFLIFLQLTWLLSLVKKYHIAEKRNYLWLWGASLSAWLVAFGIGTVNTTLHHEHGLLTFLIVGLYIKYLHNEN